MKGAEAVLRTLAAGGVDVCFANAGTTEMQYVDALDRVPEMRAVLTLFEGVATGAADGYARMADRPAATLLHLGPGLANGLANLHNAMRAATPIVNIVGQHATRHLRYDCPLKSDVAGYAKLVSGWVRTTASAQEIAADAAAAVAAARRPPGQIATLITPAECTWEECDGPAPASSATAPIRVDDVAVAEATAALRSGEWALLLLGGKALRARALDSAGRIAGHCGARIASTFLFGRMERGAGRVTTERLPYRPGPVMETLRGVRHLILVGAEAPVAFFAYPGMPSWLTPAEAHIHTLARADQDIEDALDRLAEAVGARQPAMVQELQRPPLPAGPITPRSLAEAVGALLPEHCVVVEEAITGGYAMWPPTVGAPPHDYLLNPGGSIGDGMPLAVGAALARPGRRILNLQADGSAAYTLQALWTQAREQLDVTTVIYANRSYRLVELEYAHLETGREPGPRARRLMDLDQPCLDWVALARGQGIPAVRVDTVEGLSKAIKNYLREPGPNLIEAVM